MAAFLWIWGSFLEILNFFILELFFHYFLSFGEFLLFFQNSHFSRHFFSKCPANTGKPQKTHFRDNKIQNVSQIHDGRQNSRFVSGFISRINTQNWTWSRMVPIQCYVYNNFRDNGIINANKSKMFTKNHGLAYKGGYIIYLGGHWNHVGGYLTIAHSFERIYMFFITYLLFAGIRVFRHYYFLASQWLL